MNDSELTTAFIPKRVIPYALAAVESLRSQDKLVRGLVRPELEPLAIPGQPVT